MTPVLSELRTAELLGLSVRTLQRFRVEGRGPRYLKLGRKRVAYAEVDIAAWLENCRRDSTSGQAGYETQRDGPSEVVLSGAAADVKRCRP